VTFYLKIARYEVRIVRNKVAIVRYSFNSEK